jgi:hypothetical protein
MCAGTDAAPPPGAEPEMAGDRLHASQLELNPGYLMAFVKRREFFWTRHPRKD